MVINYWIHTFLFYGLLWLLWIRVGDDEQRASHQSRAGSRWGQTQIMRSLILAGHLAPGYAEISKPIIKTFQEAKIVPLLQPHMQLGLLRSCLQDHWNNFPRIDLHFHRLVSFSDLDQLVECWSLNPQLTQTTETSCPPSSSAFCF